MDQSVLDRVTTTGTRRRRRPAPRPSWSCENCATHNIGLRKRCTDCGTTRD